MIPLTLTNSSDNSKTTKDIEDLSLCVGNRCCNYRNTTLQDHSLEIQQIEEINTVLVGNTYNLISNLMCEIITNPRRDDHYGSHEGCYLEDRLRHATQNILLKCLNKDKPVKELDLGGRIVYYSPTDSKIYLSAFNKVLSKEQMQSDLTGDGGKCIKQWLDENTSILEGIKAIVDIGAQDEEFVSHFDNLTRYVVDINSLTPFLQTKHLRVNYLIGDALDIFHNKFFSKESKGIVFTMSCFLNVLPPELGWRILVSLADQMKPGDILAITNLRYSQLKNKKGYTRGTELNGLIPYYVQDKFYKTTMKCKLFSDAFCLRFDGFNDSTNFKKRQLQCIIKPATNNSQLKTATINFVTIFLKKN